MANQKTTVKSNDNGTFPWLYVFWYENVNGNVVIVDRLVWK